MRIGVIQATSQSRRNNLLFQSTREAAGENPVVNFGCYPEEKEEYSYAEIAVQAGMLLGSGAVDFIVTGCSSGQGMMLAMNALPGVTCGYTPTPQDAFLYARINNGNAVSLPLGLNFGWSGELNLRYTLRALMEGPFGVGYPAEDAPRKREDAEFVHQMNQCAKRDWIEFLEKLPKERLKRVLCRMTVMEYISRNGNGPILDWIHSQCP